MAPVKINAMNVEAVKIKDGKYDLECSLDF